MNLVNSAVDILYLALAIGFIVLVVFVAITLMYLIMILRDVTKVVDNTKEITEKVNEYIVSPVKIATTIAGYMKPIIEALQERIHEKRESMRRKKE